VSAPAVDLADIWIRRRRLQKERDDFIKARDEAHTALRAAERAWYKYFGLIEVGPDRTHAAEVYETIRTATRR
jgi:uncharacterized protein YifE (UPF0438 family)